MVKMSKEETYVRLDNANLAKVTFAKLAKDFARYSKIMIEIKKLSDAKNKKRKEFLTKLGNIEKQFKQLETSLPKPPKEKKVHKPKQKEVAPKPEKELETFEELREEFERIRAQLEDIRKSA
ncbi:MAG: hypothetical protein J7K73_02105 [Nanoarchaeota archaeon]|nr:hypothetical protein [Nanoarchaeota archaeon]